MEVLVATGEQQLGQPEPPPSDKLARELAHGEALVGTGRISAARRIVPVLPALPFSRSQLQRIDDELARASQDTGLDVSVYLGDLGTDTRAGAEKLIGSLGDAATDAVVVAVSPGQRVVEIVTGPQARQRLADRGCKLAVMSMVAEFEQGNLAEGLVNGLRILADQTDSALEPPER
jgi:uncharacterized membrane protein YgcG